MNKKTEKKKSELGLSLFNKLTKNGFMIECPMCKNNNFHILGGFVDKQGEVHDERPSECAKEAMVVMCNECFAFNAKERIL